MARLRCPTTIYEPPRIPVAPAPRCRHGLILFGDERATGASLNCQLCRQPTLLPHVWTEAENAACWEDFMGEHEREQKQPNWRSIDALARSYAADDLDSETFASTWSQITGKEFNIQTFRWAMKKAKHFRACYGGLGAEDFGIAH